MKAATRPLSSHDVQPATSGEKRPDAERLLRGLVLAGFLVVLVVEAWLLWSVWQHLA